MDDEDKNKAEDGSSKTEKAELHKGDKLAGFEILKLLGKGGMGNVYLAKQLSMNRSVALKLLNPELINPKTVDRFFREVEMAAKLEHPNIVTAFDAGEENGHYYLAMSHVDGYDLSERLQNGPMNEQDVLQVAFSVAKGLNYAWTKHTLLHRDIKPANIMIDSMNEVKLMDMGIAKIIDTADMAHEDEEQKDLTAFGVILGTPYYMSPEQAMNTMTLDCRADIYSLGATLYHLATAHHPFDGKSTLAILHKHITEPLIPPKDKIEGISSEFSELICKMMEKDRNDRHEDWNELEDDVESILDHISPKIVGIQKVDNPEHLVDLDAVTEILDKDTLSSDLVVEKPKSKSTRLVVLFIILVCMLGASAVYHLTDTESDSIPVDKVVVKPKDKKPVKPKVKPPVSKPKIIDKTNLSEASISKALDKINRRLNRSKKDLADWPKSRKHFKLTNKDRLDLEKAVKKDPELYTHFQGHFSRLSTALNTHFHEAATLESERISSEIKLLLKDTMTQDLREILKKEFPKYDTFIAEAKFLDDFSIGSSSNWKKVKSALEEKFDLAITNYEKQQKIIVALEIQEKQFLSVSTNWDKKGDMGYKSLTNIKDRITTLNGIELNSEPDILRNELLEKIADLKETFTDASKLKIANDALIKQEYPELFSEKKEKTQSLSKLKKHLELMTGSTMKSSFYLQKEIKILSGLIEKVTAIGIADPWVKHELSCRKLISDSLSPKLKKGEAAKLMAAAFADYKKALNAGLLRKQKNSTITAYFPANLNPVQTKKIIANLINDALNITDYSYKKELSKIKRNEQLYFRKFPSSITVSIDPGGKSSRKINIVFALIPPYTYNEYSTDKPFYLAIHEASVQEYRQFSKEVLEKVIFDDADKSVSNMSYLSVAKYCNWLSKNANLDPAFKLAPNIKNLRFVKSNGFTLPTTGQWLIAHAYGKSKDVLFSNKLKSRTDILKGKSNALGLYGMQGNLAELVRDLSGNLVKKESVLGAHYMLKGSETKSKFHTQLYSSDPRTFVGFRVSIPIIDQ
ncbi:MAG: protein kinase [Lentisphaeria bacterium]|nr:serine/threonine protein kinase [Lentisphaeria bacterium]NQZ69883.1 protein kinase [Lentisphaeria bacterium]